MVLPWGLMWNLVNRSPFLSPKKRPIVGTDFQEMMRYERSPVNAPPSSKRRVMPLTPQQSSRSSYEETQWQTEVEVQGSSLSARESTVIASMEQYLNEHDNMKVEIDELELMMGPEDAEVNLRYILRNASRRGSRIFEIFNARERREHSVASTGRWLERQGQRVAQTCEERTQRNVQDDDDGGNLRCSEACEVTARRMLKYLEDSEVAKVCIKRGGGTSFVSYESKMNIVNIALHARNGRWKKLFLIFRQGENEVLIASQARWDEHLKGLVVLDRRCQTLREEVEL